MRWPDEPPAAKTSPATGTSARAGTSVRILTLHAPDASSVRILTFLRLPQPHRVPARAGSCHAEVEIASGLVAPKRNGRTNNERHVSGGCHGDRPGGRCSRGSRTAARPEPAISGTTNCGRDFGSTEGRRARCWPARRPSSEMCQLWMGVPAASSVLEPRAESDRGGCGG